MSRDEMRGHIVRGLDDSPDKLLYRQIFLDTAQLARIVMAMPGVDAERVGATGASQGGGLTLACAALARIRRAAYTRFCATINAWSWNWRARTSSGGVLPPFDRCTSTNESFHQTGVRRRSTWRRDSRRSDDERRVDGQDMPAVDAICGL